MQTAHYVLCSSLLNKSHPGYGTLTRIRYNLPNYKNNQNVLHRSIGYSDKKYMIHRSIHSTHSIFRYDFYFQPIIKAKQIRVYVNTNITLPPPIRQQKRYYSIYQWPLNFNPRLVRLVRHKRLPVCSKTRGSSLHAHGYRYKSMWASSLCSHVCRW